ncbi:CHAT domain-containing protein [Nostoc sp. 'Lobaria pulmonaria (5183) cyanobiont']|uniref:CHAT domain-containing protein n=1 Tax=Nostoc sp. 'Lobaria pulmonaria (5183) cyanobiont' TaxID=1618022 RepID=UPI000CF359AA|nr:CHAT domain-containing protein [Nostoc sp. 'Lobaria pulmonaria (5183) cyanobiont']AVH71562.1 TPR repeat-containing protein [Nostoc sp. 'Lobaria pulmonaria (5183) cyanobiont']
MARPNFWNTARKKGVFRKWQIILLALLGLTFSFSVHLLSAASIVPVIEKVSIQSSQPISNASISHTEVPESIEQLMQKGKTLYQSGQFAFAAQTFQQAAQVYQSQNDALNQALALNFLSLTEEKLGHLNQASVAITTSLNLLKQANLSTSNAKHILALVLNTQGNLQLVLGQVENALQSWQKAAKTYTEIGDSAGNIGTLINQATAFQSLGLYHRTMKIFEQVEKNLLSMPNSLLKAAGLRSFGNSLLASGDISGDIEDPEKILEQSLAVAQQLRSPQEESATLLSLGNLAFARGKKNLIKESTTEDNFLPSRCGQTAIAQTEDTKYFKKASDYYDEIANKSSSPITTVQAQLNRLSVLQFLGQQPTSEYLGAIKSAFSNLTPSRAAVYARINFVQSLVCLEKAQKQTTREIFNSPTQNQDFQAAAREQAKIQNPEEIVELLNTAVQQAKDIKDQRAESYSLGYLAQFYEMKKQLPNAQRYTESALNLAQMINAPDIAYQWEWQLGRLLLVQGDSERAVAAYTTAVETLHTLRGDLVALNPDIQFDFRDEVEPVYRQLVGLLLQSDQTSTDKAVTKQVSQKNLKQARDVIEALQLAELDNFFQDTCITIQPTPIDEVVNNANPVTAVFYSIILPDSLEIIVKLPHSDELRHFTTYKPKVEVENTLEALRQKLEQRYTFRDREELSQEVYNWIIKPAIADLEQNNVKNLVFVMDGSLRNIPMAALYDGKQYLIEKYSVALLPGLQLLAPKQKRRRLEALIAGLTESRLGFSSLSNVAIELQQIKSIIPSKQLINQAFTDTNIGQEVSSVSFPVVHLATHGKFSSKVEDTYILTWNRKINIKLLREILQTREQVVGRSNRVPPPIELLVLSACETATGDKRAALGLAGVAVRSGARSTLASLWQVDDKSTSVLMSEFYRQLTQDANLSKAEALRRAQEFVLKDKEHPFYWAPYVLVGNWL